MRNLKTILLSAALTLGTFATVLTSCDPDPCQDVTCNNGGTCLDGTCSCPSGYEGTECSTLSRSKFLNTGGANSTWLTGLNKDNCYAPGYTMDIKTSAVDKQMIFTNFAGYNGEITVSVDKISFTSTGNTTIGAVTISNVSGTIDTTATPDKISFTYTANDGVSSITCSATADKQ